MLILTFPKYNDLLPWSRLKNILVEKCTWFSKEVHTQPTHQLSYVSEPKEKPMDISQCLRITVLYEIFDIQCIYLNKLKYWTSLKFQQTFIIIGDDTSLCQCTSESNRNTEPSQPLAFTISVPLVNEKNILERFHTATRVWWPDDLPPWFSKQSRPRFSLSRVPGICSFRKKP